MALSPQPIRFITSVYGKKYGGMLLNLLYSIHTSNPYARATIFWQDMTRDVRLLEKVFPTFEFVDTAHTVGGDLVDRIAHKMLLWADAASRYPGERLVFVDVDMLVRKDIRHFFDRGFDLAFTYKDELYPLNTGTFLAVASPATTVFFNAWDQRTKEIVQTPHLRSMAVSREYPYGAPDQMAAYEMIGFKRNENEYRIPVENTILTCVGFPCRELNETNSRPIDDHMHIIHYKGGWHSILLDGTDFTSRRTKRDSFEMYREYLRSYKDAVRYVSEHTGLDFDTQAFGIRIPFYLNASLEESSFLYRVFHTKEKLLTPFRKLYGRGVRFLRRTFTPRKPR